MRTKSEKEAAINFLDERFQPGFDLNRIEPNSHFVDHLFELFDKLAWNAFRRMGCL